MNPILRSSLPRVLSIIVSAIVAASAGQSLAIDLPTAVPAGRPPIEWAQFNRWENGSIEALMGTADVGFLVFLPLAYHCRAPIIRPVSKYDVVTVYRGNDVRSAMPLGGGVPPAKKSVRIDTAISGTIHCKGNPTRDGENNVTLRLVDIELKDTVFRQIGPIEAIPSVPPP